MNLTKSQLAIIEKSRDIHDLATCRKNPTPTADYINYIIKLGKGDFETGLTLRLQMDKECGKARLRQIEYRERNKYSLCVAGEL